MTTMKITGKFKSYDDLLVAYGTDTTKPIDEGFDAFLHKIADQECILVNYNAWAQTFDASFLKEVHQDDTDPNSPMIKVQDIPYGIMRGYTQNLGLDTLVKGSIVCDKCEEGIYCTGCGYQVDKETRYDYEPKFTYGDIFNGQCEKNDSGNLSGARIAFKACKDGNMFCPDCLSYQKFKEIKDSIV